MSRVDPIRPCGVSGLTSLCYYMVCVCVDSTVLTQLCHPATWWKYFVCVCKLILEKNNCTKMLKSSQQIVINSLPTKGQAERPNLRFNPLRGLFKT